MVKYTDKRLIILIAVILIIIIALIPRESHIIEKWYYGSESIILDKTDETLLVQDNLLEYVDGENLDGNRARAIFEKDDCLYELYFNENETATLRTIVTSAICPIYNWSLKKK